jgi:hypothetical protein
MLKARVLLIAMLLAAVTLAGTAVRAQESSSDQQKDAEAYMKAMALTENHAFLANLAGDWKVTTTAWAQIDAEPWVSEGTATGEMILGGRFLMLKSEGTMFGQPFEGYQIIGFDNIKQKYVTLWIDNTSTGLYLTEGTRDRSGKTLTDMGEWPDPLTGGTMKVWGVTHLVSPDEFTYDMFVTTPDSSEFQTLHNRAERIKQEAGGSKR